MFNNFTKRLLDITVVVTKLAFVVNFLDQEGSENVVVAWKQSPSACGAVCEGSSASLADDVACRTLGDWQLPGDAETDGTLEGGCEVIILDIDIVGHLKEELSNVVDNETHE